MDQEPRIRRAWWRFSLREMFLLILVVAVFLGWGTSFFHYYFWRYQPSAFLEKEDESLPEYGSAWVSDIKAICDELVEPIPESVVRTITYNAGNSATQRTMYFRFPLLSTRRKAFIDALLRRVHKRLKAAGCLAGGETHGFGVNETRTLNYQCGPASGAVDLCITEGPSGNALLIVNICEAHGRFHASGVSVPQVTD